MTIFPFIELKHQISSTLKQVELVSIIANKTKAVEYGTKRLVPTSKQFEGKVESDSFRIRAFAHSTRNVTPFVYGALCSTEAGTSLNLKAKPWIALRIGLIAYLLFLLWIVAMLLSASIASSTLPLSYFIAILVPSIVFCIIYFTWKKFFITQSQHSFMLIEEMLKTEQTAP